MLKAPIRKKLFCLFGAVGGGAKGFRDARVHVAGLDGEWECIGSVDIDERANQVFGRYVGSRATTLDLADRTQYRAIHGREPPEGWQEASPEDLRRAAGHRFPDCVFLSAPCKGFSGLLSETLSLTDKYQAMNRLTLRGVWLMLEAWRDNPPGIVLFENVPRLATRGAHLLDQITQLFRAYGYAVNPTTHDCGHLGGLAQSRKRFLLVARHLAKVPAMLYEPPKLPLRAVGDVLGKMPLPGDPAAGIMHRVPQLQWKTWVRLAFVEAGSDWRSLNRLTVEDGCLREFLVVPEMHRGGYGVRAWAEPCGVIASGSRPSNGAFSVADPRFVPSQRWTDGQAYIVKRWDQARSTVTGACAPGSSAQAVADPRHHGAPKHNNEFRVVRWEREAGAVTGAHGTGQCVADPRNGGADFAKYAVAGWGGVAGTVISGSSTGQGAYAVADPRSGMSKDRIAYQTGGHYGVVPWDGSSGAVSANACQDNGRWSVADPRGSSAHYYDANLTTKGLATPAPGDRLVARIRSLDGTWHRPFTTLELAALQSLYDPEDPEQFAAFGDLATSDGELRTWIGNAVPPRAAQAIGEEVLRTLLLADAGETFQLSSVPVWVRPLSVAMSLGGVGR